MADIIARGMASSGMSLAERAIELASQVSEIGRYLSTWDCTTGLPGTNPDTLPYSYKTGDYFVVSKIASSDGTNYMPNGSSYTGDASTTVDTSAVAVADMYRYDGTSWERLDFHLAVESKLDKVTGAHTRERAYGVALNGTQKMFNVSTGDLVGSLLKLNDSGHFSVLTPTLNGHPANKGYVDDRVTTHETWTFTLDDGTTVTKEVCIWTSQS